MPSARSGGRELFYEDSGGDGPAVLFSHGFLMDRTMFDPQVEALSPEFRCVRWDAPGFGRTPVSGPFTYWDLADDAVAILDDLGIPEAAWVGMSQGGFVSLRGALRHPERVRALVLVDSDAATDDEQTREGYRAMLGGWIEEGPDEELLATMADLILGSDPGIRERWIATWKARPGPELRHPMAALLDRDDVSDRLGEIRCPALVVHGEGDVSISMERAERVAAALPGCTDLVRVPGAMHAPNLTHPGAVNPALLAFLRSAFA